MTANSASLTLNLIADQESYQIAPRSFCFIQFLLMSTFWQHNVACIDNFCQSWQFNYLPNILNNPVFLSDNLAVKIQPIREIRFQTHIDELQLR